MELKVVAETLKEVFKRLRRSCDGNASHILHLHVRITLVVFISPSLMSGPRGHPASSTYQRVTLSQRATPVLTLDPLIQGPYKVFAVEPRCRFARPSRIPRACRSLALGAP